MRQQSEIDSILHSLGQTLDTRRVKTGLGLHVPPQGYAIHDDWLTIVVEPDVEGVRAAQYVEALGEIEDELRQHGMEKVIIVPALAD